VSQQTEIQLYMSRARQDLQAADTNLREGFYAVAITRAYYAMFYAASALLARRGIARSRHGGVLSAFGEEFVKTGLIERAYAKMLANAFDSRLDSDYDLLFVADKDLAEDVLGDARRFVARAADYLQQGGAL
jgi:uncharacterized protein (UPF0332 family)